MTDAQARMPILPSIGGTGALSPWGGPNASRWRPEAILANATSEALNRGWATPGARDVAVAVPLQFLRSNFHEFGDGQTNTAVAFSGLWREPRPQLVATWVGLANGGSTISFRFDRSLQVAAPSVVIQYAISGAWRVAQVPLSKDVLGDAYGEWVPDPALGIDSHFQSSVIFARPSDWADWFPVTFRSTVLPIQDYVASVRPGELRLPDSRQLLDPEQVSVQGRGGATSPFQTLIRHQFGQGYNQTPYNPQSIHARFPSGGRMLTTGVGQGWTWVLSNPPAPFKVMYTCFERRRADLEASASDGGVASGGGWHEVGDNAETILNSLENEPLVVSAGFAMPAPGTPSGGFSYGLTDVAVVRFLQPGEAFITPRGDSNWGYAGGRSPSLKADFHWYYFQQDREVCTEEWIHPCVPSPSNSIGMRCP
jgi:hypothetical protein